MEKQKKEKILKLASDLDKDLESQKIDKVLTYFSEDGEIELFGLNLVGKEGIKKWLTWFFGICDKIQFEPIVIMVEGDTFFEEFIIHITQKNGKTLSVKVAEVLIYEDFKIKSLRLYLDRLQFSELIIDGFFGKKIVETIKKKSLNGLLS